MGIRGTDRQIDNIEFNVSDIARSKAFYGSVFGWAFTDYGPSYTEFSDGRLTGGFTTGSRCARAGRWSSCTPTIWRLRSSGSKQSGRKSAGPPLLSTAGGASTSSTRMVMSWRCGRPKPDGQSQDRNPPAQYREDPAGGGKGVCRERLRRHLDGGYRRAGRVAAFQPALLLQHQGRPVPRGAAGSAGCVEAGRAVLRELRRPARGADQLHPGEDGPFALAAAGFEDLGRRDAARGAGTGGEPG